MPTPALKRVNSISDIKKRAQSEERRLSDGGERTVVTVPVAIAPTVQAVVAALSEALGAAPPTPAPVGVDRVVDTPAPSDDGRSDSGVSPFRPRASSFRRPIEVGGASGDDGSPFRPRANSYRRKPSFRLGDDEAIVTSPFRPRASSFRRPGEGVLVQVMREDHAGEDLLVRQVPAGGRAIHLRNHGERISVTRNPSITRKN